MYFIVKKASATHRPKSSPPRGGVGSEDLTDGRGVAFKVVATREVLVKEGCCEGMHGRVWEHGAPAVDQGVGEGVAQ